MTSSTKRFKNSNKNFTKVKKTKINYSLCKGNWKSSLTGNKKFETNSNWSKLNKILLYLKTQSTEKYFHPWKNKEPFLKKNVFNKKAFCRSKSKERKGSLKSNITKKTSRTLSIHKRLKSFSKFSIKTTSTRLFKKNKKNFQGISKSSKKESFSCSPNSPQTTNKSLKVIIYFRKSKR